MEGGRSIQFVISLSSDAPTLSFKSGSFIVAENEGRVEVCLILSAPLGTVLDVFLTLTAGSAVRGLMKGLPYLQLNLYDRCMGVERHQHGLHIPCSRVKT